MAMANPLWGALRIHGELLKLGFEISERTVSNLIPKHPRKPSSQTWRAFLKNHMTNAVSIDFFTVPTERLIQSKPSNDSKIFKLPSVGGLHNRYQWKEAA